MLVVVAIIGAMIASWQLWLARTKLKFDLFDRRYKVYDETMNTIANILTYDEPDGTYIIKYKAYVSNSIFLFDKETYLYLREIERNIQSLHDTNQTISTLSKNNSPELQVDLDNPTGILKKNRDLSRCLGEQLTGGLAQKLAPYLNLSESFLDFLKGSISAGLQHWKRK